MISYLSGPNMYAHTQTFLANDCGRRIVQNSYHCYFHYAWGFATPILAHMLDSLVRVSRRGKENHFASVSPTRCRFHRVKPRMAYPNSQRSCCKQQEKDEQR